MGVSEATAETAVLTREGLGRLLEVLRDDGWTIVAPVARGGAIVLDEIERLADLPAGWTDEQDGGTYRLVRRDDDALFGYAVGPHSWKQRFLVPRLKLWSARREADGFTVDATSEPRPRLALLGARSCDLHAIAIQDRVLRDGAFADPDYAARRADVLVVAVQCGKAGGTCFCVSMGTGPRAEAGFDLALTEILDDGAHRFIVEVGSARGRSLLARLDAAPASDGDRDAARAIVERTARSMGRTLDPTDVANLLQRNLEHPRWDEVAARCLTCANCTLVCPTCFCTTVEDVSDLTGDHAERWRRWDSCFNLDFSYIHGGSVRSSTRARYRQWLTHKLGTWIDQFGTSGCVGCGRCITWCPVGIDLTEEVGAIRATDGAGATEDADGDA